MEKKILVPGDQPTGKIRGFIIAFYNKTAGQGKPAKRIEQFINHDDEIPELVNQTVQLLKETGQWFRYTKVAFMKEKSLIDLKPRFDYVVWNTDQS